MTFKPYNGPTCGDCYWWHGNRDRSASTTGNAWGQCFFEPPASNGQGAFVRPSTKMDDAACSRLRRPDPEPPITALDVP